MNYTNPGILRSLINLGSSAGGQVRRGPSQERSRLGRTSRFTRAGSACQAFRTSSRAEPAWPAGAHAATCAVPSMRPAQLPEEAFDRRSTRAHEPAFRAPPGWCWYHGLHVLPLVRSPRRGRPRPSRAMSGSLGPAGPPNAWRHFRPLHVLLTRPRHSGTRFRRGSGWPTATHVYFQPICTLLRHGWGSR